MVTARRTVALFLLVMVLASTPLIATFVREVTASDRCLDAGSTFDHARLVCDSTATGEHRPFIHRHRQLVLGTAGAFLVLLGLAALDASAARGRR